MGISEAKPKIHLFLCNVCNFINFAIVCIKQRFFCFNKYLSKWTLDTKKTK